MLKLQLNLLYQTCLSNNTELATFVIERGADVNIRKNSGQTPLYATCYKSNTELATFLIERGADVNIAGNNGHTPLYPIKLKVLD